MSRKPFMEGFLTSVTEPLEKISLIGSKCNACGVAFFGRRENCENCGSTDLKDMVYGRTGKVHSYTVQRAAPPQPYAFGPSSDNWAPRPVAWIELPEGVRLLSFIDCKPEEVKVDLDVQLVIQKGWQDEAGNEVICYQFKPAKKGAK